MSDKYVAYAGSYTHESSKGIHIYDMDVEKGRITERKEVQIDNPSYLVLSHSGKFLYSICDRGVAAYKIEADGDLTLINVHTINGMRGCHLTLNKQDTFLIVSGYHDGKITVLHINEDGSVGKITDEVFHKGIGSVAERNFRPHVSSSVFTPDEELLCVCDLGIDQIKIYEFNHTTGKLKLYDIIRSRFEFVQNIFTLRKSHKSNSAAANLIFSNDGNNCLCSNAGDNTVTIYKVNKETGELYTLSSLPVSGDYPKYISMFPDDKHILSMNNEGNSITIFTIHFDKGLIVMNGPELKISRPNNLVIKKLS